MGANMLSRRTFLVSTAALAAGGLPRVARAEQSPYARAAASGRRFLTGMVDSTLDLVPEYRGSNVFWIFHDNYMAARVLDKSDAAVAARILKAVRKEKVPPAARTEALFGDNPNAVPARVAKIVEVRRVDNKIIKSEGSGEGVMDGWQQYADLLLLSAMVEGRRNKPVGQQMVATALRMWDGRGMNDVVARTNHFYAAYKLALAMIAAADLGMKQSVPEGMVQRLLAQQSSEGGFVTDYEPTGKLRGVANVETTSMAIMAMDRWG